MSIPRWTACIAATIFLAVSCGSDSADRAVETGDAHIPSSDTAGVSQTARVWRGYAVHGHEVRSFRPCGWDDALWAIDVNGLLWEQCRRLASTEMTYREVFAVIEARRIPPPADGFGMDYPGALEVGAVLYAGLEGPGCDEDWDAFQYRAYGNEPFWSAEVSADRMSLSRLGHEDRHWHDITRQLTPAIVRYIGTDTAGGLAELTIIREPCRDSMSGAYYGFSAVLRMGQDVLYGCALSGER